MLYPWAQRVDELDFQLRRLSQEAVREALRRVEELRRRLQAADLRLKLAGNRRALELLLQRLDKTLGLTMNRAERRLEDCECISCS